MTSLQLTYLGVAAGGVLLALFVLWVGVVVIGAQESGLIVRRYGRALPAGRLIATKGEAGYQAQLLPPG